METVDFLSKDFCLQPGLGWKFLLRRTWSGEKLLPLQFPGLSLPYYGKPSSHAESDGKSTNIGGGGRIGILKEGFLEGVLRWALRGGWVLRRVLRRGSKKGFSRRHLEGRNTPFQEYNPLRVRPNLGASPGPLGYLLDLF